MKQVDIHMKKKFNLSTFQSNFKKTNLKLYRKPNCKTKTTKPVEEKDRRKVL